MTPYHSALKGGHIEDANPLPTGVVHYDNWGNSVQVWDINGAIPENGDIPEEFYDCDLIYAEPMWPAGVKRFDERAGAKTPHYNVYATSIGMIIKTLDKPTVMIASARVLRFMPQPSFATDIMLNGNKVQATFWNGAFGLGETSKDLIRNLAGSYDCVGDFCAGYGTTGRLFIEAGKKAVLSDYNAACCGYIAENLERWGR